CAFFLSSGYARRRSLHSFPTRRSSDLTDPAGADADEEAVGVDGDEVGHLGVDASVALVDDPRPRVVVAARGFILEPGLDGPVARSEEHTSELQSRGHLVCRLLLEKKKK